MATELQVRYQQAHRAALDLFEQRAAFENHWLMYALWGWENLLACGVCHYLLEVEGVQSKWPYVAVWLAQIAVAWLTLRLVAGPPYGEESPLEPICRRVWTMFVFLCISVAVWNVLAGQPIFVFLPALAGLSSMGFAAMTVIMSKRCALAGVAMFLTGMFSALFPHYGFLIYGAGWLIVLQAISLVFLAKRSRWLVKDQFKVGEIPVPRQPATLARGVATVAN